MSVEVEGWPESVDRSVVDRLALSPRHRWFIFRLPVDFYPGLLDEDVARLKLHLSREGFPDAEVFSRIVPKEEGRIRVVFEIDPGDPILIESTRIAGWPADVAPRPEASAAIEPGHRVRDAAFEERRVTLENWLLDRGHARATVGTRVERVDSEHVDVAWEVSPGAIYHFGDVVVSGVDDDLKEVARASFAFHVGSLYSRQALRRSEENLRLLGLFRRIQISTTEADSNTLDIRVQLQARDPQTFRAGIGYWTDDGVGGYVEWWHRNLLKRGRGVRVRLEASRHLQRARTTLQWPALFRPRTLGSVFAEVRRESEDAYILDEKQIGLDLVQPLSMTRRVRAGVRFSLLDFETDADASREEFDVEDPDGPLTRFRLGYDDEAVDDVLDAHEGSITLVELETAPPWLGSAAEYTRIEAERSQFLPIADDVTAVFRIAGGLAWPIGKSESVLLNERLYGGGSRSVRGYQRRELGPKDSSGDPIGGQSKAEANLELRFPLWRAFHAATFLDTGQVWRDTNAGNLGTLAWAAGAGLYLRTPVGVIRVDLGFPLGDLDDGQPPRVYHLSIGQPF